MNLIEALTLEHPAFVPSLLLILGTVYFNYKLTRNYPHFHWNLFMIALGLLGISFLIKSVDFIYSSGNVGFLAGSSAALSAILFAFTAYIATESDKKWRS